jgi:uncharacterized membrane protein YvbJ
MQRCRECNSSLKKDETECYTCGTPVVAKTAQATMKTRFVTIINILFLISAAMTVASLFITIPISFMKCMTTTLVLLIVKSSAAEMREKKEG